MNTILIAILIQMSLAWNGRGNPTPNPASADEQTDWHNKGEQDWTGYFDYSGWKILPGFSLMYGWERSGNAHDGADGIYHIEKILTAEPGQGFQESQCTNANWWNVLDHTNSWAQCPDGKALHGLYRTSGNDVSNIEQGKCCPGVTTNCYEEQSVSSELDFMGQSACAPGHALAGIWRGTCNSLHCIEYFKCCRLIKFDPHDVRVIGYWDLKESVSRDPWSDIEKSVTLTMSVGQSNEVSESEQSDWRNEVSETHSVTVAVEASAEYGPVSGSLSSEYGYEHSQNHEAAFSQAVSDLATTTFEQDIEITESYTIPKFESGEPIYANRWYFKTKAIKPEYYGGYIDASNSLASSGITTTGCGFNVPPNCLPGHCKSTDPKCWECEPRCQSSNCDYDFWKIDKNFQPPPCTESSIGSSSADIDQSATIRRFEAAQLSVDNAVGIENFSKKATKIFSLLGAGAVLYGLTFCVLRKSEYKTIDDPEL